MIIRKKESCLEYVKEKPHVSMSRREFIERGLTTGVLSVSLHEAFIGDLVSKAIADVTCPSPVSSGGGIFAMFASGGSSISSRAISTMQATAYNAQIDFNYGTGVYDPNGGPLIEVFQNCWMGSQSTFYKVLAEGPPGFLGNTDPAVSAAEWRNRVLNSGRIICSHILGYSEADDGAGENLYHSGGTGGWKDALIPKDINIGISNTTAPFAAPLPRATLSRASLNIDPDNANSVGGPLAGVFSMIPRATDGGGNPSLATPRSMEISTEAARAIADRLKRIFNPSNQRKAASIIENKAYCEFVGNASYSDPLFGATLFRASGISDLTSNARGFNVAALTNQEKNLLAAAYRLADGTIGGTVNLRLAGRDYHNQAEANVRPQVVEEARVATLALAAAYAKQERIAFIYTTNGSAGPQGTDPSILTVNGVGNIPALSPNPEGDTGGFYSGSFVIMADFRPNASIGQGQTSGTIHLNNGRVIKDPNMGSELNARIAMYATALAFINGGSIPQKAIQGFQASGMTGGIGNKILLS